MNSSCFRNVLYGGSGGHCVGDLYLPGHGANAAPVLLIHGGGWNGLSKEAVVSLVPLFLECGRAVFNINYSLLDRAPWPACGNDCATAVTFILEGGLASRGVPAPETVLICGASAGGHLAMIAGLRIGGGRAGAIISLAGPSRLDPACPSSDAFLFSGNFLAHFFGGVPSPELLASANPVDLVTPDAPPLYCIHSRNDRLVPAAHSAEAVGAWHRAGVCAELVEFDGPGDAHGFWTDENTCARRPGRAFEDALRDVLARLQPALVS